MDSAFVAKLLSQIQSLWSPELGVARAITFQSSKGGTPPVDIHWDQFSSTFILYLTDNGLKTASVLFPNADFAFMPQKGDILTWLNVYEDGRRNPKADHMVQAHQNILLSI